MPWGQLPGNFQEIHTIFFLYFSVYEKNSHSMKQTIHLVSKSCPAPHEQTQQQPTCISWISDAGKLEPAINFCITFK